MNMTYQALNSIENRMMSMTVWYRTPVTLRGMRTGKGRF